MEWYGNVTRERSGCGVVWERGQAMEWYGNVTRERSPREGDDNHGPGK